MVALIPSDRPAYRLLKPFFGPNDHLYQEDECIIFHGTPNEDMEPLNQPARDALKAYLKKLDDGARALAEKNGRPYTGRTRNLDEAMAQATADARQTQLTKNGPGVPIMGARKKTEGQIERLEDEPTPETGGKRSRSRVSEIAA